MMIARSPYDIADAMRLLANPGRYDGNLAIRQTMWCFLKEARGQRVDLLRLDAMHAVSPPAPRRGPGFLFGARS